MQSIEDKAIEIYSKNMLYLLENHPKLAKDLQNLDLAMQENIYSSKFDLEYINDNFDIKNLQNNTYMYDSNSDKITDDITKRINFKKDSGCIEGFGIYDISKLDIENKEEISTREDIYPLMNYHIDNVSNSNKLKEVRKFIFLGVGLGLHITKINQKINASDYLIIEDDLEIFKLSLFTTEYFNIAKKSRITFSILEDDFTFSKTFKIFLANNFAYNHLLKYVHLKNHSNNKIKLIQSAIANQDFMVFPYKKRLDLNIKPLTYLNNSYKFLDLHEYIKNNLFDDKPILVIAAGPSLKGNIPWLSENAHKFCIIAVSAVIKILYDNNIKPDIVTQVDTKEVNYSYFEGFDAKEFLKDSILIFVASTIDKIINIFPKEQVYLFENLTSFNTGCIAPNTPCVGSFSTILGLILDAKEIYLIGLDLAFNQETMETHIDSHTQNTKVDISKSSSTSLATTSMTIKGNFKDYIYTNPLLFSSIEKLNDLIPKIATDKQSIYNLSDGAKIDNTIPLKVSDIKIDKFVDIEKIGLQSSIHNILEDYTCVEMSKDDILLLKNNFEKTLEIRESLNLFSQKTSYNDSNIYIQKLINLLVDILSINNNDNKADGVIAVYYDYFVYILAIIEDFFNTEGTKGTKNHIKKINKLVQIGLYNIQDSYENALKEFLEGEI